MNELGMLEEVTLLGNHTSTDSAVNEGLGGLMPNTMYTVVPYNKNTELLNKYASKYGKEPTFEYFYTAAMYDAVYLLKEAITKCNEDTVCIQNYLKNPNLNFNGKVAVWNFDSKGDPILSENTYYERRIENGVKKYYQIN